MTEEFLLIGFDEVVISIPHYKIRNHYPTRLPLVWALLQNSSTNEAAAEVSVLSGNANASVCFENKSVKVKIIEFSSGVIGSGPMKSIPSFSQVL